MVLYPSAQKRAQEELDRVLGHARLPEFGDQQSLSYLQAILLEVMRLYPVAPLSTRYQFSSQGEKELTCDYRHPAKSNGRGRV